MMTISKMLFKLISFYFKKKVFFIKDLDVGDGVVIKGKPIIQISKNAKIALGKNVTLNSLNYGYHANMYSPVKLMADREHAIIKIGDNTRINGACLHAYNSIEIGKNCLIAANVQILDASGHELSFENPSNRINTSSEGKPVVIEDNVWIGLNAIILAGVRIGQGSVIGANTVVTKDVPSMVVFVGSPGKVVKKVDLND
ncbi:acetyltransferase-like isoleucine patch superfamily enzyme [Marinomonas alcarazii]|uniref:Acetyltransferase-like isoleucine patch superfamily enzyme n=1 Tax=Marinomonas alcarazii TaxID=491949 RepID=A0A318UTP0_9GAMM|nr:acyltransferase [Marinomonas alcarazii]PYF79862.1 acetyltransferase-like isoleucine patch superfamily enzyme [Marinomonas alcarazii]